MQRIQRQWLDEAVAHPKDQSITLFNLGFLLNFTLSFSPLFSAKVKGEGILDLALFELWE